MQVVCEATQCQDKGVKVLALQCLVKIMSLYYQFMEKYMVAALFPVSFNFFTASFAVWARSVAKYKATFRSPSTP